MYNKYQGHENRIKLEQHRWEKLNSTTRKYLFCQDAQTAPHRNSSVRTSLKNQLEIP